MQQVTPPSRKSLASPDTFDDAITSSSDQEFLMGHPLGNSMDFTQLLNHDQLDLGICRKKSLKMRAPDSEPQALPALVPSFYKRINRNVNAGFHKLNDDVKLHIMSFLEASDGRAIASTCHTLRRFLLSKDAAYLWKEWCHRQWSILRAAARTPMVFRDDFDLPTALGKHLNNSLDANIPLLLSMASRSSPTRIDESKFEALEQPGIIHNRGQPRRQTEPHTAPQVRSFTQDDMPCVQFIGTHGERCIVADKPLPRPKRVSSKGRPSLCHALNRTKSSSNSGCWRPFVAPFMTPTTTSDENSVPSLQAHLTPRLVSYFEATIMQRDDESKEPPLDSTDCVAVGVSCKGFRLTNMPGWDSLSYGYHGDDGGLFHGSGNMLKQFGPRYGPGDTVGCGVDYVNGGIFFSLNGNFLGYGWTGMDTEFLEHANLYPTVGVADTDCPISCNFGERPFRYDLIPLVKHHGGIVEGWFTPKEPRPQSKPSNSFRRPRIVSRPLKMKMRKVIKSPHRYSALTCH